MKKLILILLGRNIYFIKDRDKIRYYRMLRKPDSKFSKFHETYALWRPQIKLWIFFIPDLAKQVF